MMMAAPLETMAPVVVAKSRLSNMMQFGLCAGSLLCASLCRYREDAGQPGVFAFATPAVPPRHCAQHSQLGNVVQVAAVQQTAAAEGNQRRQIADHAFIENTRKLCRVHQAVLAGFFPVVALLP